MRVSIPALAGILTWMAAPVMAQSTSNAYIKHNLVSDQTGVADLTDPNVVNAWGIAFSSTGPFWVTDAGTGLSTVYSGKGSVTVSSLKVTVPPAPGGAATGSPTGIVFNGTASSFPISGTKPNFIFDTLDGTISSWASSVDATHAVIQVNNSASGAIYTGLAIGGTTATPWLYAANFHAATIEVYDTNYKQVSLPGAFVDANVPKGFAPFNVWNLNNKLYVTYAQQDSSGKNYVGGAGSGYVDVYDMNGVLLQKLTNGGPLNAPWGVAIAPANFGKFSNMLLVGNFGDGRINAFDPASGASLGPLQDADGNSIQISGLWALIVGNGGTGGDPNAIYFAAGTGGQQHGLIGSIQAGPAIPANAVVNAGSSAPGAAPGTILSIYGQNLASTSRNWASSDFDDGALPTKLDGVSVSIHGKSAYVTYVSPSQVNVIAPDDSARGPVPITITNNGLTSAEATIQLATVAPGFFLFKGNSIAALHSDNKTPVGASGTVTGSTPAAPGETIVLYATGLGATNPEYPAGQLILKAYPLTTVPLVSIGGIPAAVEFAGLTGAGVYQLNVTVPSSTPNGDNAVIVSVDGVSSPEGATINVQQ